MTNNPLKKICILSPAHPLRGGIASSTERLAQELQANGYEVNILSFKLQYPSILFPGKTQYSNDPAPDDLAIESALNSINPFNWLRVGSLLKKQKPDLIIVRYWLAFMAPSLGTVLRLAKSNKHTKVIAIVDNLIPHEPHLGHAQLTSYFVNTVDAFVAMSNSVESDIRQVSDKPLAYIPHPIYDNYGDPVSREEALTFLNLTQKNQYLLFFGFIRNYKGLDLLLEAMADERIREMGLKLIVAGEFYASPEPYHQLIKEKKLDDQVILRTDFIPNAEVKYYFGAADLVAQPYRTATQSGISQLAYHFEKPMLVTRVGGLPEIVKDGKVGYVVDVEVAAIADAIIDFFEHNRSEAMTAGVCEEKKRFSWDNLVKGIEGLYQKIKP